MTTPSPSSLFGTKFLATVGCGFCTTLLCWHGKISDDIYAFVIIGTVGAFITGDVIQKVKEATSS